MGQHVALVRQHPGAAQRIGVAVTRGQHRLVEFHGLHQVVALMAGRCVDQRVGQVQLHAGPLLRVLLGGVDLQRGAQRLCGHTESQLTRRLRHRHRQIRRRKVGVRGGPQQRCLLPPYQLQSRMVMRHSVVQQLRTIHRLLVQQPSQRKMKLRAGDPQILGVIQRAQGVVQARHCLRPVQDRGGRTQQDPAQRFGHPGRLLGGPVQQRHRRRCVTVLQRAAGLRAQHRRRQLPVRRAEFRHGVAAAQGEQHDINQDTEFAQCGTQLGGVGAVGIHDEPVVAGDGVVTAQRGQRTVAVVCERQLVRPQGCGPLGQPAGQQREPGVLGVGRGGDQQVPERQRERTQWLGPHSQHRRIQHVCHESPRFTNLLGSQVLRSHSPAGGPAPMSRSAARRIRSAAMSARALVK